MKSFAGFSSGIKFYQLLKDEKILILLENSKQKLRIEANLKEAGVLIAPEQGKIKRKIKEEVLGEVKIHLYTKQDRTIYEDTSCMVGIEIVGF